MLVRIASFFRSLNRVELPPGAPFTVRGRHVMELAKKEAQRFNHEYIGTEHILLGLLRKGFGVGGTLLKKFNIELKKARQEMINIVQEGPDMVTMGKLPQTKRAKMVIEYAIEESRGLNHNYVGTEHLLLGMLRVQESVACEILTKLGIKLEDIRMAVHSEIARHTS